MAQHPSRAELGRAVADNELDLLLMDYYGSQDDVPDLVWDILQDLDD